MTRKYRLERTAFIGCRNTAYMDVDDAEPCPFCGSRQVTIYPYGQGTTSYVEGVPTLYLSSATCKCRGCTAEIDGPQCKSIIREGGYERCVAYIDCEDLFRLPPDIAHADVIDSSRDHIKVLDHQDAYVIVPCTCLDIK